MLHSLVDSADGGNISEAIKYFKAVEGVLSVSQDRQWRLL